MLETQSRTELRKITNGSVGAVDRLREGGPWPSEGSVPRPLPTLV